MFLKQIQTKQWNSQWIQSYQVMLLEEDVVL